MHKRHWLLPEGIEELLPPQAHSMELLRRRLLDCLDAWGYELITPPLLEYVESLLTGTGSDLDLQTFKLVDQISGRTLGIRSDITPQAARIDAHQLGRNTTTRLCYAASVLHTKTESFSSTRSPFQIGAEIYGQSGIESDLEIICLMLEVLSQTGITDVTLDIGHVGIFRGLARHAQLNETQEQTLFSALQRKATHEIIQLTHEFELSDNMGQMFITLAEMSGDDALEKAQKIFENAPDDIQKAVADLLSLQQNLQQRYTDLDVHFDLAELRGYHYHTGIVFAAYISKMGEEIARGGRYDHIGEIFGRARAACGFSADLMRLFCLTLDETKQTKKTRILAPFIHEEALILKVADLRKQGFSVVNALSDDETAEDLECSQCLVLQDDEWQVEEI